LKNIIAASEAEIASCPGFGPQKTKKLQEVFDQPLRRKNVVRNTQNIIVTQVDNEQDSMTIGEAVIENADDLLLG